MEREKQQKKRDEEQEEVVVTTMVELSDLPENCISIILALTSPRDACRSSVVSSVFKSACESDELWERFLPSDYREILSRSSSSPAGFPSSKKELYFHLSENPNLIDGGKKSFQIDRETGKKCFMIGARELAIAWGDDERYWTWRAASGSRFAEVAVLKYVWWLDISGKIDTRILSRKTNYGAYIVFKTENPGGLTSRAINASVKFVEGGGGGACSGDRAVYFDLDGSMRRPRQRGNRRGRRRPQLDARDFSVGRGDGWMEIEIGEFFNDEGEDGVVEMAFKETDDCKSGLIVQGFEVRPKA